MKLTTYIEQNLCRSCPLGDIHDYETNVIPSPEPFGPAIMTASSAVTETCSLMPRHPRFALLCRPASPPRSLRRAHRRPSLRVPGEIAVLLEWHDARRLPSAPS